MRLAPLLLILAACGRGSTGGDRAGHDAAVARASDAVVADASSRPAWRDQVTVVGTVPKKASQLEIVGDAVWAGNGVELARYPLDGSAGRALRLDLDGTAHVAIDGAAVVAIDAVTGKVSRFGVEDGKPASLGKSPALPTPAGLFGLGTELVWATDHGVLAMPLAGGKVRTVVEGVEPRGLLAGAGDQVIFVDGERLVAAPVRGGKPRSLAAAPSRLLALQVVGDRIYWMDGEQVASVPLAGGEPVVHARLTGEAGWLAVASDRLVWMERDPTRELAVIRSLGLPDGPSSVLLELPPGRGVAAIHDGRLYFTTEAEAQPLLLSRPL